MNPLKRYTRTLLISVGLLLVGLLSACGGGGDQGRDPILGLPAANLVSVTVTPATAAIAIGATQQFKATANYADGSSRDVTSGAAWTSATPAVGTINGASGLATGVAAGTSAISASFSGSSGSAVLTVNPATLRSLALTPATPSLALGATQQLQALGTFSDGSTRDLTAIASFVSATPAIATVTASGGLVTGVKAGTSVITASTGGTSASITVTVNPAVLVSLALTPANPTVVIGATRQLTVTATYSDQTITDVSAASSYVSATPASVTVTPAGLATGVAAGSSVVTASFGGKQASTTIAVPAATLASISVTPASATVVAGGTQRFVATGTYSDNSRADISAAVSWTSSNTALVTVLPGGVATGVAGGSAVVTASLSGKSATATLNVTVPVTLASIAVTPATATVTMGATQRFVATGTYTDNSSADISASVNWTSSSTAVATVLPGGVATGIAGGSSAITATLAGKSGSATLSVTVPVTLASIAVTPATATVAIGATQRFVATGTYSDNSSADISASVTWTSSSGAVTVLPSGVATGVAGGSSTITAALAGKTGSAVLTVTPAAPVPTLSGIAITPAAASVAIGASQRFVATGTYSDNTTADISSSVNWISGSPAIASVQATGIATGVAAGSATIGATLSGRTASAVLTVLPGAPAVTLTGISITPSTQSVLVGATPQLLATGTFSNGTTADISATVTWSSSANLLATVAPGGSVSALAVGSVTLTATQAGISASATLTINAVALPATLNLGSAANFGVLAGTSLTNNAGGLTVVTGDIGAPSQTVAPVQLVGYANYTSGLQLTNGLADLQTAIADANGRLCTSNSAAGIDLGGLTLSPGVYCYGGPITITGGLVLSGPGLYIFRTASTFNTVASSVILLTNGATAANVFWVPTGATTLGANTNFKGSILSKSAAITLGDGASTQTGRVLSGAAVTLSNNSISK